MQDYSNLYVKRFRIKSYSEKRSQSLLNKIRRVIHSKLPPMMQLVAVLALLAVQSRR